MCHQRRPSREDYFSITSEGLPQGANPWLAAIIEWPGYSLQKCAWKNLSSGTKCYGQMRLWLTCTRVKKRGKCGEKKRNSSWSKAYHLIGQTWWRCYGLGLYGCPWNWNWLTCDDVTAAAGWVPRYTEISCLLRSKESNLKLIRRVSNMQQDKTHAQKDLQVGCSWLAKSITWPQSNWACISLAGDQAEGK